MSISSPVMTSSWHGALPREGRRRDRVVEPGEDLVEDRVLVRLEREQRLAAGGIDAGDQRIIGAVLGEHDGGTLPHIALLHRLADIVQRHRPVDIDEFAVLPEHIEELAKVLVRQGVSSEERLAGTTPGTTSSRIGKPPALVRKARGPPEASLSPIADWPLGAELSTPACLAHHEQIFGVIEQVRDADMTDLRAAVRTSCHLRRSTEVMRRRPTIDLHSLSNLDANGAVMSAEAHNPSTGPVQKCVDMRAMKHGTSD